MATTFIEGLKVRKERTKSATIHDSLAYIKNPLKTDNGRLVTAAYCLANTAAEEMELLQDCYEQETGRRVNQIYRDGKKASVIVSMRQSFLPGEVDAETAHEIGCKMAERFLGDNYQYVVATHINSACIHNHIIFNIIGDDLRKFRINEYTYLNLRRVSDRLSKEYDLSIVVPSQKRRSSVYSKNQQTSFRTILKNDIDRNLRQAASYDELLQLMKGEYFVSTSGKYLSFKHRENGQQRNIRAYSLGEEYTEKALRQRVKNGGLFVPEPAESEPVTFSQTLRNAEAAFHTVGLLRDMEITRFGDFEKKVNALSSNVAEVQKEMNGVERELAKLEKLLESIATLERYADLKEGYANALLPERFYFAHSDELEDCFSAEKALAGAGTSAADKALLEQQFNEFLQKFEPLQSEFMDAQTKIAQINEAQRIVSCIYADEKTNLQKGGSFHDR